MLDAFSTFGIAFPAEQFGDYRGKTDLAVVKHAVATYLDGPPPDLDAVVASKQAGYRAMIPQLELISGARVFLEKVAAHPLRLALTTSAERVNQRLAFDRFDLSAFFEVVVTSEDVRSPKPDPEPYRITAERLGLATAECIVFEDSVNGVLSAVGAGCRVVGLSTSFPREMLTEAGAHVVVDSYAMIGDSGGVAGLVRMIEPRGA